MTRASYIEGFKVRQKQNRRLTVLAVHKEREDNDGDLLHAYYTDLGWKEAQNHGWTKVSLVEPPVETKKISGKKSDK